LFTRNIKIGFAEMPLLSWEALNYAPRGRNRTEVVR